MLKTRLVTVALASLAAAFAAAPAAHAADDYFLKIDGVSGESVVGLTKDAIAVNDYSFGIENPAGIGTSTGGAGTGKAKFDELKISKAVDSTSPVLMQKLATGAPIPGMELVVRRTTATPTASPYYIRYSFQPVFITRQEHSGSAGDDTPSESLTFQYGAMRMNVTRQDPKGSVSNVIKTWNQVTNSDNPLVPDTRDTFNDVRFR
jgi:type VI secretion system secreted protein Hcp